MYVIPSTLLKVRGGKTRTFPVILRITIHVNNTHKGCWWMKNVVVLSPPSARLLTVTVTRPGTLSMTKYPAFPLVSWRRSFTLRTTWRASGKSIVKMGCRIFNTVFHFPFFFLLSFFPLLFFLRSM